MKQIFISSVQKEFERERAAIKKMVESCFGDKIQPPGPVKGLVNVPVNVPIDVPINETTPGKVLSAIKQSPDINRTQLAKLLKVDVKTIGRAIAALSASVEHRGSKKAGGYYLISQ